MVVSSRSWSYRAIAYSLASRLVSRLNGEFTGVSPWVTSSFLQEEKRVNTPSRRSAIQKLIVLFIGLIVICRVRHVRMIMERVLLKWHPLRLQM